MPRADSFSRYPFLSLVQRFILQIDDLFPNSCVLNVTRAIGCSKTLDEAARFADERQAADNALEGTGIYFCHTAPGPRQSLFNKQTRF